MPSNNEHTPEQEDFSKLLGDLRSMPQAKAPSNFEYLLQQKINESLVKPTPWWNRFFFHGFEIGGFRLPAYAYGGAFAVLIITFGLYMYNASDFDTQLQKMDTETPLNKEMQPKSDAPSSAIGESEEDEEQPVSAPDNAPAEHGWLEGASEPAASSSPEPAKPAVPAPSPARERLEEFKDNADPDDKQLPTDDEDMMPRTRGIPNIQGRVSGDESIEMEVRQDLNEKSDDARKSVKKEMQRENDGARSKSMMGKSMMMAMPKVKLDSLQLKDSLRKLDSLRSLKTK